MPGVHDRRPSSADRPPVSRVGDELQQHGEDEHPAEAEREAIESATRIGWDQTQTAREGRAPTVREGDVR